MSRLSRTHKNSDRGWDWRPRCRLLSTRLFEGPCEDQIRQLEPDPALAAGELAHVDQDGVEGDAGLVGQLLLVQEPPQKRLLYGQTRVAPDQVPRREHAWGAMRGPHRGLWRGPEVVRGVATERVGLLHEGPGWEHQGDAAATAGSG